MSRRRRLRETERSAACRARGLVVESLEERSMLSVNFQLLKDINAAFNSAGSGPQFVTEVGGVAYFTAATATAGRELWKSDGTEGGTVRVKDIRGGAYGSNPTYLTNVGGTLYFTANDGVTGYEL